MDNKSKVTHESQKEEENAVTNIYTQWHTIGRIHTMIEWRIDDNVCIFTRALTLFISDVYIKSLEMGYCSAYRKSYGRQFIVWTISTLKRLAKFESQFLCLLIMFCMEFYGCRILRTLFNSNCLIVRKSELDWFYNIDVDLVAITLVRLHKL